MTRDPDDTDNNHAEGTTSARQFHGRAEELGALRSFGFDAGTDYPRLARAVGRSDRLLFAMERGEGDQALAETRARLGRRARGEAA